MRALVGEVELGGVQQEGRPRALEEVPALDLDSCAVQLQQAAQEGLLVEVVTPHEHQRRTVRQALRHRAVADLAQQHVRRRDLQPCTLSSSLARLGLHADDAHDRALPKSRDLTLMPYE